ncbi:hypothetical protein [Thalassotalea sp. ND16A]|uniref:hypothetical protein n=1 Tax=Thalassotalea sp. ND16A TaxID=1535422 RepID=UPI00051D6BA0|nr:hypothetical protein [Thalassotalea sp. ND16A]KGJ88102.1 hypothetical protein ND16A_2655 [Thalassotalea sp. ND16A]
MSEEKEKPTIPEVDFKTFLEETPPNHTVKCIDFDIQRPKHTVSSVNENIEPLLYCPHEKCKGNRLFFTRTQYGTHLSDKELNMNFIKYTCRNCGVTEKVFAYLHEFDGGYNSIVAKVGEIPKFGKRVPEKVNKLIKSERDLFFKGMANENQGMGIGAFSYYRRVLDSQKDRIFDKIIQAVEVLPVDKEIIEELKAAKAETQFTKAVDKIKAALPQGLLISGHNPLKLLYSAVSEGLHNHTDEECLQYAQSIRLVLFEFAERLDSVLKANRDLSGAVKMLAGLKPKAKA